MKLTEQHICEISTNRDAISAIIRQLEAVRAGRGFFNIAFLRKNGLIIERQEHLHLPTYSRPTGRTNWLLTDKGRQMLTAGNHCLMHVN